MIFLQYNEAAMMQSCSPAVLIRVASKGFHRRTLKHSSRGQANLGWGGHLRGSGGMLPRKVLKLQVAKGATSCISWGKMSRKMNCFLS